MFVRSLCIFRPMLEQLLFVANVNCDERKSLFAEGKDVDEDGDAANTQLPDRYIVWCCKAVAPEVPSLRSDSRSVNFPGASSRLPESKRHAILQEFLLKKSWQVKMSIVLRKRYRF